MENGVFTNSLRATAKLPVTGNWQPDARSVYAIDWHSHARKRDQETLAGSEGRDQSLVTRSLDRHTGIWNLCVSLSGEAILRRNDYVVAILPAKQGAAILRTPGCPFECAAEFVAALNVVFSPPMSQATRMDFEFDVAKWITLHFDG